MKTPVLLASLLVWSCPSPGWSRHTDFVSPEEPAAPQLVTAEWLKQHLGDPGQLVFQVSMDRLGYDAGHIPGAIFAALGEFHNHMNADQLPEPAAIAAALGRLGLSNGSRVILVGDPLAASILFVALDYVGHGGRTAVLDGGFAAWREAGGTLSRESPTLVAATFVPNVRQDMVVNAAWVRENLRRIALMDARTRAEYDGTANERLPRLGHIPGARFVPWLDTFDPRDVPKDPSGERADNAPDAARLLPRAELETLLTTNGARKDGLTVTYCTIGMRASHLYFIARLLGYPARIYVGSMADWTRNPDNPVVGLGTKP